MLLEVEELLLELEELLLELDELLELEDELELLELEDELELLELEDELQLSTTPNWLGWSFSQVLREIQVWPFSQDQPLCATWHNGTFEPHQLHTSQLPPLDELDELLLEELELLELLLEDELLEDELLEDELLELDELLDDELLLELVSVPMQVGRLKLPSWLPWKPNVVLWPCARLPFQLQQLLNDGVEVEPPDKLTFQLPVTLAGSPNATWMVQPLIEPGPLLVTVTSS